VTARVMSSYASGFLRVVPAPNKQLQRTVILGRVRAAGAALPLCARGAHDTSARGR
jgi:hypothetical protein